MHSPLAAFSIVLCLLGAAWGGEIETRTIQSSALGMEMKVNVLLPDGYQTDKDRRFPVIYLLHGLGGDYTEWARIGITGETAGLPAIIVMPEGDKSFYVNHHQDPRGRWEDYLTTEVVKFVDQHYRTTARRESRGISGLSMGGYGAMVLGLRHPDLFASISSHSGALDAPRSSPRSGEIQERLAKVFGPPDSKERTVYDLFHLIRELPADKRPDIYINCGSQDFLLEANRAFVQELSKQKVAYEYREVPGAHNFEYWKRNVRYSLTHQLAALERARAGGPPPAVATPQKPAGQAQLLGDWDLLVEIEGRQVDYVFRFREKEKQLQAVLISPRSGEHPAKSASFKDGVLRVEIDREFEGQPVTIIYEGKLSQGGLSGSMTAAEFAELSTTWTAKRKAQAAEEL